MPRPGPDAHGLITRRAILEAGVSDRWVAGRLASGEWVRLRAGVYVEAELWHSRDRFRDQPVLRIRAALTRLRQDVVLSHDSAAILLGMGAPDPPRSLVHVTRPKVHGDAVRAGIKHHLAPYADSQVRTVDGLRILDPARTALDMAREHGLVAGVACADQVLAAGWPRGSLHAAKERMPCWPHSTVMAEVIELASPGAESWLESEARLVVVGLGLGTVETQFGLSDGGRVVWCDLRIGRHVVEVDGALKYADGGALSPSQVFMEEKSRHDFVAGFKLGVSRVTASDLRGPRRTLEGRLRREILDTHARYGTDLSDLAPYRTGPRRRRERSVGPL